MPRFTFFFFGLLFFAVFLTIFDTDTEKNYPWSNQEKSVCAKYHGVDDMIANFVGANVKN